MMDKQPISLQDLRSGYRAEVLRLDGGFGLQRHLDSLGIRPGKIIRKITAQPMRGPTVIELDGSSIAIGRGMARRIIVKELSD